MGGNGGGPTLTCTGGCYKAVTAYLSSDSVDGSKIAKELQVVPAVKAKSGIITEDHVFYTCK